MPFPPIKNGAKQCTTTAKTTGKRCLNPAAYGCTTCRMHGARKNIKRGQDHPLYKHGGCTLDTRQDNREASARFRDLEAMAHDLGLIRGGRRRVRKT